MRSMANLSSSISRGTKYLFKHVNESSLAALAPSPLGAAGRKTQNRPLEISAPVLSPLASDQQRQADIVRTQIFAALGDVGSRASERYAGAVPGRSLGDGAVVVRHTEESVNVASNPEFSEKVPDKPVSNDTTEPAKKGKHPEIKGDGPIDVGHGKYCQQSL